MIDVRSSSECSSRRALTKTDNPCMCARVIADNVDVVSRLDVIFGLPLFLQLMGYQHVVTALSILSISPFDLMLSFDRHCLVDQAYSRDRIKLR